MSKNKKIILLILGLSVLTHFAFFGHPNQTVFDEVHFGKFISGYFTGQYFFDIHPPLGKLLISGMGYLSGFKPGFSFTNIGETFPDRHYLWLRFLPALAGTLLPLVVFLLAQTLGFSSKASLLAGLLIVFENALLVQSRFILLDSFLLLFGFSALLFYLKFRHRQVESLSDHSPFIQKLSRGWFWITFSSVFVGLSASVKWTGLSFLALILILELIQLLKTRQLLSLIKNLTALILIPTAIYMATFAIHLSLLPKSGPGDAFMSPGFQKTLAGNMHQNNSETSTMNFINKFVELNKQMYSANQRITAFHPYGSSWYSWPFLTRSVFFWQEEAGTNQKKIYLLGNPFVWWTGTMAMILLLIYSAKSCLRRKFPHFTKNFLILGFFINLLPFIGIQRVMFLYHYFLSLIFSILALAYWINQINKKNLFTFLIIISLASFLYFSPLTYGLSLSPQIQNYLFWFASWR